MGSVGRAFRLFRTQPQQFLAKRHVSRPFSSSNQGNSSGNAGWNWAALRKTLLTTLGVTATVYVGTHFVAYRRPVHALKSRKVSPACLIDFCQSNGMADKKIGD